MVLQQNPIIQRRARVISPTAPQFTELAAELRNRIYEYALPHDEEYKLGTPSAAAPPLCLVSRKVREETLPIWRSTNVFMVDAALSPPPRILVDDECSGYKHINRLRWTETVRFAQYGRVEISISVSGEGYDVTFSEHCARAFGWIGDRYWGGDAFRRMEMRQQVDKALHDAVSMMGEMLGKTLLQQSTKFSYEGRNGRVEMDNVTAW